MFCSNCGAGNSDDALFCESCGNALGTTEYMPLPTRKANTSFSKLTVVLGLEIIAVVLLIYSIYNMGKKAFSIEHTAEAFFVNMANGEWEKAYRQLDADESEFINAGMFAIANRYNAFGIVNHYRINIRKNQDDRFTGENAISAIAEIDYIVKGSTSGISYPVSLNRQADKKYFMFNDWRVNADSFIFRDYFIRVPVGSVVTLDGVELGEKYIDSKQSEFEGENLTVYKIPYIFCGVHDITVSMEGMQEVRAIRGIGGEHSEYSLYSMKLQKKTADELIVKAGQDMQQIYSAAISEKDFSNIKDLFTEDSSLQEEIAEDYNSVSDSLHDDIEPVSLRFDNIKGKIEPSGSIVELEADYKLKYKYRDGWGDEDTKEYKDSASFEFEYVKEEKGWVLKNLGCKRLWY